MLKGKKESSVSARSRALARGGIKSDEVRQGKEKKEGGEKKRGALDARFMPTCLKLFCSSPSPSPLFFSLSLSLSHTLSLSFSLSLSP